MARGLAAGEISSRELTEDFLRRSERWQRTLNAYIEITGDRALATAKRIDALRCRGEKLGPLAGIPMALKDNISTRGVATTCASRVLAGYIPPYDAAVVEKLGDCPLLGKANLDEFAMGSSNSTSAYGPACNPWDPARSPGGSSGGSAALVAAGCAPFSLGTDTGGSVRQPAAFCGVTGFKPSYGRVSRWGLLPLAPSLDQVGVLTPSVEDCALVLQEIAGHDSRDATSAGMSVPDYRAALGTEVSGLKIGLCPEVLADCSRGVGSALAGAARELEKGGGQIISVSLPFLEEAMGAYLLIASAEAASSLARYDGVAYGYRPLSPTLAEMYLGSRVFGPEVLRRLLLGVCSQGKGGGNYELGQRVRRAIVSRLDALFGQVDLLLLPVVSHPAFRLDEEPDPLAMHYNDLYSIPANLAGLPALALPCGFSEGLPLSLQLMAPRFREDLLLAAGSWWQRRTDWHHRRPREVCS